MAILACDQSGDLRYGYFYQFHPRLSRDAFREDANWIVSSSPNEKWFVRAVDVNNKWVRKRECPLDSSHVTYSCVIESVLDLYGGDCVAPIVPSLMIGLINQDLAERLATSGLCNVLTTPAKINVNQSGAIDPQIRVLQFAGRDPRRGPRIVPESANRCIACGQEPLICPACGHRKSVCNNCGEQCLVTENLHKGESDKRIKIVPTKAGFIVDPKMWDGSDFSGGSMPGVITRRALDYLLSLHVAPFGAKPLRVDVSGLTAEEIERLEESRRLPKQS